MVLLARIKKIMKIQLLCNECGYEEWGSRDGLLINKIKMWNHLKRAHPMLAERMMQSNDTLPSTFFRTIPAGYQEPIRTPSMLRDVRSGWSTI